MIFYTTKAQESLINRKYNEEINKKQFEIDEEQRKTGKLQKYTAYMYIEKPHRIFNVENNQIYIIIDGQELYSPAYESDGGCYRTDQFFDEQLSGFIERNKIYTITFFPSGSYGNSVYYYTNGVENVMPAVIKSLTEEIKLENEDNYDIGCL